MPDLNKRCSESASESSSVSGGVSSGVTVRDSRSERLIADRTVCTVTPTTDWSRAAMKRGIKTQR